MKKKKTTPHAIAARWTTAAHTASDRSVRRNVKLELSKFMFYNCGQLLTIGEEAQPQLSNNRHFYVDSGKCWHDWVRCCCKSPSPSANGRRAEIIRNPVWVKRKEKKKTEGNFHAIWHWKLDRATESNTVNAPNGRQSALFGMDIHFHALHADGARLACLSQLDAAHRIGNRKVQPLPNEGPSGVDWADADLWQLLYPDYRQDPLFLALAWGYLKIEQRKRVGYNVVSTIVQWVRFCHDR